MKETSVNDAYIISSLRDAALVLQKMMQDLSPNRYYTISELADLFPQFTQNKIYRIIKTFESIGWVEADAQGKGYKIGHELLYLSDRYFRKLHEMHLWIKQEINSFNVGL